MKYAHYIGVIFWLAVGLLLSLWSLSYNIGTLSQPGPGFYPLGLGILLIFFSLILLGQGIRSSPETKKTPPFSVSGGWKRVAYAVLILLLLTFLYERIGYLLTFFLLIMLLMAGAGPQSWRRIILVALFSALGVYLVFVRLLQQPLPRGFLGV